MTFEPARPRSTLSFDGKDYELLGTLEVVESIEGAFREGIIQITTRVLEMGVADTAKLLSILCKIPQKEAGAVIFNKMGANSDAFRALQMHLYAFLRILLEPPEAREQMAQKMGEFLGKLNPASPGDSIKSSASAS